MLWQYLIRRGVAEYHSEKNVRLRQRSIDQKVCAQIREIRSVSYDECDGLTNTDTECFTDEDTSHLFRADDNQLRTTLSTYNVMGFVRPIAIFLVFCIFILLLFVVPSPADFAAANRLNLPVEDLIDDVVLSNTDIMQIKEKCTKLHRPSERDTKAVISTCYTQGVAHLKKARAIQAHHNQAPKRHRRKNVNGRVQIFH